MHLNSDLKKVLWDVDLGSPVAESDRLLESARVETSVFGDILNDRVDLVPGTKGSGKSALYRIFVDFLSDELLSRNRVVVAHGVQVTGDEVFQIYQERFSQLSEDDFVDFWCIYLISLADEHFLRDSKYGDFLSKCNEEVKAFQERCRVAKIPRLGKKKRLREVLDWALNAVLTRIHPKMTVTPSEGTIEMSLFDNPGSGSPASRLGSDHRDLPRYVSEVKNSLEAILRKAGLHLWLMIDRLDEVFPRRTKLETQALRGLLRTLRIFESSFIRVKIFLRDDILEQVTAGPSGFTALTHITARRADKLRWSEERILDVVVNRLFTSKKLCEFVSVDRDKLGASHEYRVKAFYEVFPRTVHPGQRQSETLRWIYNHTSDGRGVVTPRDVIELLTRAKQRQQDECEADPGGSSEFTIGPAAIRYGLAELSRNKRETVLQAEYPHFWPHIKKLRRGKTEYTESALRTLFGSRSTRIVEDLIGIGVLSETVKKRSRRFKIPFLYREGLEVTQGLQE